MSLDHFWPQGPLPQALWKSFKAKMFENGATEEAPALGGTSQATNQATVTYQLTHQLARNSQFCQCHGSKAGRWPFSLGAGMTSGLSSPSLPMPCKVINV